jgi:hypothetical protein
MSGWRRARTSLLFGAAILTFAQAVEGATLHLRGGQPAISGERIDMDPSGVRVSKAGVISNVAWDQVQSVSERPLNDRERALLATAEDVWRARSRVQRGDFALALPLFERHFPGLRGTNSETGLIVAEGLLRCRLATGRESDRIKAIPAAIEVARLRRAKISTDRYNRLGAVLDEATFLCPQLAPTWRPGSETLAVAEDLDRAFSSPGQNPATADVDMMRVAALYSALLRGKSAATAKRDEGAIAFLAALVALQDQNEGNPEANRKARAATLAAAKDLPAWANGWAKFAVGRSMANDADPQVRLEGVLELLGVAAIAEELPSHLTLAALEVSEQALRGLGDTKSAGIIEREFARLGGTRTSVGPAGANRSPAASPAVGRDSTSASPPQPATPRSPSSTSTDPA